MAACVAAGGSITGEHGVGKDKMDYMPLIFDAETLGAMQAVRRVFDPAERANPGKVLPVHACREWRCVPAAARTAAGRRSDDPDCGMLAQLREAVGADGVERDPQGLPRVVPDSTDADGAG